ncbi:hypothetical protein JZ751_011296 [Albula glossodonta]|uniref:Uncharacterized protein n=1 Tax=Albula glossodonta TaxID=121402 RepID=A0A8T2NWV7_9TELE|nr:hypothetical protein JZ751_011296 [Albula glossodonta]
MPAGAAIQRGHSLGGWTQSKDGPLCFGSDQAVTTCSVRVSVYVYVCTWGYSIQDLPLKTLAALRSSQVLMLKMLPITVRNMPPINHLMLKHQLKVHFSQLDFSWMPTVVEGVPL